MSAREQAFQVIESAWQQAQRDDKWRNYDEAINGMLDALLAAVQEDGSPLVILGPEKIGRAMYYSHSKLGWLLVDEWDEGEPVYRAASGEVGNPK